MSARAISTVSSVVTAVDTTSWLLAFAHCAIIAPDASVRSPRATESETVRIARRT
jgi:hypothetical protein